MRWLLVKDLRILRRSPLMSALLIVYPVHGTQLTDETRFRVGSITKTIVATLVLDAVSRGDLSLDEPVGDVLPDVTLSGSPISIKMLLDHTSGLFNVGDEGDVIADIGRLTDPALRATATDVAQRYVAGQRVLVPDRVYVALAETHDRYFEPGSGYHYSNVNYQLAAMALTRAMVRRSPSYFSRASPRLGLRRTTLAPYDSGSPEMRVRH